MKPEKYKSWKDVFHYYQGLHDTQTVTDSEGKGTGRFRTNHYYQYSSPMHGCTGGHSGKGCSWWCPDRGAGMRLVPIDRNWTTGYAFDIFSGGKLKPKPYAPKEDFIRCWINLSSEKITEEGGHYPCLAMQFRQSPMKGGKEWAKWQMVPSGKGNDPYGDDDVWKSSNSWAETGIDDDLDVLSLNDLDVGSSCPVCQTGFLIDSDALGGLECNNNDCGNIFESGVIFDQGWKADAEYGQATPKALRKGGSHSKPNLKVWESFLAIEDLWKSILTLPHVKEEVQGICEWIGMRLTKPTVQWGKPVPREDDAWLPWVVKTGSPVSGNTLQGYPHLALAALIWAKPNQTGSVPLLDNELLRDIHNILLEKDVPGLDNPWRERDVLFVVDILRLMCFDMDVSFDWTPVP